MRTSLGDKVYKVIRRHVGASSYISAPAICKELGWRPSRERFVRQLIADESPLWDDFVCSIPGRGYFVAESAEDLVKYHHWLSDLAAKAKNKVEYLQKFCRQKGINIKVLQEVVA